jgi:hypothetical protein
MARLVPAGTVPPWLKPGLIASLAGLVEAEVVRGTSRAAIVQRAREAAFALCPALPRTHLTEAVNIALWVGRAQDAGEETQNDASG